MKNGGHFAFWPGGASKQFSKILKKFPIIYNHIWHILYPLPFEIIDFDFFPMCFAPPYCGVYSCNKMRGVLSYTADSSCAIKRSEVKTKLTSAESNIFCMLFHLFFTFDFYIISYCLTYCFLLQW
jgi:hypothetical protein